MKKLRYCVLALPLLLAGCLEVDQHPEWLRPTAQAGGVTTYDLSEPDVARVRHPGPAV